MNQKKQKIFSAIALVLAILMLAGTATVILTALL